MAETKVCKKCLQELDLKKFCLEQGCKTRRSICSNCRNRANYAKHNADRLAKIRCRRQDRQKQVYEYLLNHPCVECGETELVVLEFDHVRGKKKRSISWMTMRGYSWEIISKEISKCEVRCANCHRRKTARQLGWLSHLAEFVGANDRANSYQRREL